MVSALSEVVGKLSHVTPSGHHGSSEMSPNSVLLRSCDFEMYDENRLADMLQEGCL